MTQVPYARGARQISFRRCPRLTPKTFETESADLPTEIALFRYGLIAQLVHTPPDPGQRERLLREIAARTYQIPGSTRAHVSVTTLRRYLKTYRDQGFEALRPCPRADAGTPRAFPSEVLARAVALREEQPARTTQTLVDIMQRDANVILPKPINVHTLTTHLRQRGKTRRLLGQTTKVYRRFERDHVNSLWQGDALVGPWLPDPQVPGRKRRAHLFCFLDDHSRLVPHAEFFFDEALPRLERVLKVALLRRGVPQAVYVDQGQVYSSVQFSAACATLGIERIQTAPYSPEAKGKQERFCGSLREPTRRSACSSCRRSNLRTSPRSTNSTCRCGPGSSACITGTNTARRTKRPGPVTPPDSTKCATPIPKRSAARSSGARNGKCAAMPLYLCKVIATRSPPRMPGAPSNCASIRLI
ncbi:MAG: transposase [Chloroflexi bacterium]|nr:transposase [Chloroflexota bacterium]